MRQSGWQETGDTIQKNLNGLLSTIVLRQVLTNSQLIAGNKVTVSTELNKEIEGFLKLLAINTRTKDPDTYVLADGFSETKDPSLELISILEAWKDLLGRESELTFFENNELHQKIVDQILEKLKGLGYSYALNLTEDYYIKNYSRLVLQLIPRTQELIKQMMVKSKRIMANDPDENYLTPQVIGLDEKVRKSVQNFSEVFREYSQYVKESSNAPSFMLNHTKNAFYNYVQSIATFLDILSNNQYQLLNETSIYENTVGTKDELFNELYNLQHPFFLDAKKKIYFAYYFLIGGNILLLFILYLCLKYQLLSSHLEALRDHIKDLSVGKLSHCFSSNADDEFGMVGKALDKVVDVIHIIISDLVSLSKQIGEITERVAIAIREQEGALQAQEKIILEGEKTAQNIADKALFLSDLLNEICQSSKQSLHAEAAGSGLKKMYDHMNFLAKSSREFLASFDMVADEVQNMLKKVNFMDRLGEQAKTLSLKGKIENTTINKSAGNFSEITNTIERFSDNSEKSTSLIKKITKDVSADVKDVRAKAEKCFSEINTGAQQLTLVSQQLEQIAHLAEDQQVKFLKVDEMMKIQSSSSRDMITAVQSLMLPARENTVLVKQLPQIILEIIEQQKRLVTVVNQLVYHD